MKTYAFPSDHQRRTKTASLWLESSRFSPLNALTAVYGQLSYEQLRASVREKARQGDYPSAIAILNQLLESCPESATDYNNRGLMYFCNEQFLLALQDYDLAIALNDKLDSAYNNRANCYAIQGNLAAALRDYERALDLNPSNLRALINQGITLREVAEYDLALEKFDLALLLGSHFQGRIYAERGYTYHLRGDWNCAIADYQRALNQLSDNPDVHAYQQKVETWLNQLLNPIKSC